MSCIQSLLALYNFAIENWDNFGCRLFSEIEGNFTFTGEFSGPAVAAVLTVEVILAVLANGVSHSIKGSP